MKIPAPLLAFLFAVLELSSWGAYAADSLVEDRNLTGYAQVMEEWTSAAPSSTGLVGHWRFDEAEGNVAIDSSGAGLHNTSIPFRSQFRTRNVDSPDGIDSQYVDDVHIDDRPRRSSVDDALDLKG